MLIYFSFFFLSFSNDGFMVISSHWMVFVIPSHHVFAMSSCLQLCLFYASVVSFSSMIVAFFVYFTTMMLLLLLCLLTHDSFCDSAFFLTIAFAVASSHSWLSFAVVPSCFFVDSSLMILLWWYFLNHDCFFVWFLLNSYRFLLWFLLTDDKFFITNSDFVLILSLGCLACIWSMCFGYIILSNYDMPF